MSVNRGGKSALPVVLQYFLEKPPKALAFLGLNTKKHARESFRFSVRRFSLALCSILLKKSSVFS